jgi:hypothetical protein
MTNRLSVDAGRIINILVAAAILILVLSLASTFLVIFVLAAFGGALAGGALFLYRSRYGLGATFVAERAPEHAGKVDHINMAHIPVMGAGGLGLVAMSIVVALVLPEGRSLMTWSLTGAVVGAGAFIMWRHFHSGTPFAEHPEETLHLR